MSRGQHWITRKVPYNQNAYYPDVDGVNYRTDCSGFVAMALHATPPGANTVGLIEIAKEIKWEDLQLGDFVGTLGAGTEGNNGHVTLFGGWVTGKVGKRYKSLECMGTAYGCLATERDVKWPKNGRVAKPYKYVRVK
jgi:hypothetical protein